MLYGGFMDATWGVADASWWPVPVGLAVGAALLVLGRRIDRG